MNAEVDRMNVMGHGGMYDELGQVSTMLGTGHANQRRCGERIDAVRDELEALDRQLAGAVSRLEDDLGKAADALDVAAAALEEARLPLSARSTRAAALHARGQ